MHTIKIYSLNVFVSHYHKEYVGENVLNCYENASMQINLNGPKNKLHFLMPNAMRVFCTFGKIHFIFTLATAARVTHVNVFQQRCSSGAGLHSHGHWHRRRHPAFPWYLSLLCADTSYPPWWAGLRQTGWY